MKSQTLRPGSITAGRIGRLLTGLSVLFVTGVAAAETIVVKADRVRTGAEVLEPGAVLIRDGKIAEIGARVTIPGDARVIELRNTVVTPGLIDAMCVIDSEVPQAAPRRRRRFDACPKCKAAHPAHLVLPGESAADCPMCRAEHREHTCQRCASGDTESCTWCRLVRQAYAHQKKQAGFFCVCAGPTPQEALALASAVSPRGSWAEHSSEVIPHTSVLDSVNLLSRDFERLAREGVTTVFLTPDSASVIGSRGAVVKTAGRLAERVVRPAGAVKATMGADPARRGTANIMPFSPDVTFMARRPTTRMGVQWIFRKAFYDARRAEQGLSLRGADTPTDAATPVLREILAGKLPLRIQARMQHDILLGLTLAREFGLRFTLEEATEAYKCLTELAAAQVPVIFGPTFMTATGFRRVNGEANDPRLATPRLLHEAGIRFALTAQEMREEEGLVRQAMYATRFGLPQDAALAAITTTPAALLDLDEQVGTLKPGSDADLVIWNAEPLSATSRPLLVMIDGQVVFED